MTDDAEDPYLKAVREKAERMARARRDKRSVWVVLGQAGTLGWQFVLVLVGCTLAGRGLAMLIDHDGPTLVGIVLGLVLGVWTAARSLRAFWEDE
ncbi:MAG: AtpZ/AtpI family protein [Alphaproteobacteria bacterium]|nr:AtpZ/AtpI family protein [Alphaproteobacteria bacterium]